MANKQPIELFMPPNMLKAKVGGGLGGVDMAAMKRAEEAMNALKSEFSGWIADDVKKLTDARARYSQTQDDASRHALLRAAHDIKGQAPTFNYPLIARVAGTLSRLIGELPPAAAIPVALVDAHVNAIQVIHKLAMQDTNDKTAQALCAELDARVDQVLKAAKK
ncbi:MAG TPA: Hpt domain-containing protein [Rhizomicrobium sp.]|jgi:chemotaxis protein histidine kinase CheA|nr:Hpt domain-containing protein [Rhizomicrobium sp.]